MQIKDCLYREIRYGLCAGSLSGLLAGDHVKLDLRTDAPTKLETDYPWLILRRITSSEDNQVRYARERFEFEVIGLRSSATKGDDLLETIRDTLIDHFAGRTRTFGQYAESGTPDPSGGLKLKGSYVSTVEGFDESLEEKAHILIFVFTHIRL